MSKDWRYDGPDAVIQEMIDNARASPEQFSQRGLTSSSEVQCEVCLQPIAPWTSYHLTCFIEDDEPQFIRQHIFCPRSTE